MECVMAIYLDWICINKSADLTYLSHSPHTLGLHYYCGYHVQVFLRKLVTKQKYA